MPGGEAKLTARQSARLAARLRELRGDKSLRKLAEQASVSPGTIHKLEQGLRDPRLGTMLALRDALGLSSIEELLGPMPSQIFGSLGGLTEEASPA